MAALGSVICRPAQTWFDELDAQTKETARCGSARQGRNLTSAVPTQWMHIQNRKETAICLCPAFRRKNAEFC